MTIRSNAESVVRLVRGIRARRRGRAEVARILEQQEPLAPNSIQAIVYFADAPVNLYQIRQWYEPLVAINDVLPVAILSRSVITTPILVRESPLPVVFMPNIHELELFVRQQDVKVAFFVNQNTRNFSILRFPRMMHVFLSHGESDKAYMASNQAKSYDYVFVAGQAAVERLNDALMAYRAEDRTKRIGRPQFDVVPKGVPSFPDDERIVVAYAPTWEGDRPSMSYGSVETHGRAVVGALLADPRFRVIYRPHPRTGIVSPEHKAADLEIRAMIKQANSADPSARHMFDETPNMEWHRVVADACISDNSAAALDWFATGKPLIVTRPVSSLALLPESGYLTAVPMLAASDAASTPQVIAGLVAEGADWGDAQARARWREYYFGDTAPGASMQRWRQAVLEVAAERDRWLGEHAGTVAPADTLPEDDESDQG